jgi:hypothetical protein
MYHGALACPTRVTALGPLPRSESWQWSEERRIIIIMPDARNIET